MNDQDVEAVPFQQSTLATLERLRQPIDPSLITVVDRGPKQGVVCAYEWHTIADVLDERAPGWRCESEMREVRGTTFTDAKGAHRVPDKLICRVTITIGEVSRDNWGEEDIEQAGYGSAVTNAYAQAFKRAAAMFGCGRELYDKDYEPALQARTDYAQGRKAKQSAPPRPTRPNPGLHITPDAAQRRAAVAPSAGGVGFTMKQREQGWEVSDGRDYYLVFKGSQAGLLACTCADYHFRESDAVLCRHIDVVQTELARSA